MPTTTPTTPTLTFSSLPPELRTHIFRLALPPPRVFPVLVYVGGGGGGGGGGGRLCMDLLSRSPSLTAMPLAWTCWESRRVVREAGYVLRFGEGCDFSGSGGGGGGGGRGRRGRGRGDGSAEGEGLREGGRSSGVGRSAFGGHDGVRDGDGGGETAGGGGRGGQQSDGDTRVGPDPGVWYCPGWDELERTIWGPGDFTWLDQGPSGQETSERGETDGQEGYHPTSISSS